MNQVKKPVATTSFLVILFCMIWLLYGTVDPIVCSEMFGGIYIDEPTLVTLSMLFTMIFANFLNNTVPRLNHFHILINVLICLLVPQGILRLYDQNKIPVIVFFSFLLLMGILIAFFRKRNQCKKLHFVFYMRHVVAIGLIGIILPAQFFLSFSAGCEYYSYVETEIQADSGTQDYNELKGTLQNINWGKLTLEEKIEIIKEVILVEGSNLGLKDFPVLSVEDFKNSRTVAFYENNKIHFNAYYFATEKNKTIGSAFHELYHKYQMELIDKTKKILSEETLQLQYFEELESWISANEKYMEDKYHYDTYYNNTLEKSAREYADKMLQRYGLTEKE